jgi:hypothetical protein
MILSRYQSARPVSGLRWLVLIGLVLAPRSDLLARSCDDEAAELVARVRAAVGAQGTGATEARAARDKLATFGASAIPYLLDGMDTPDTVAANWLRTAWEQVVERAMSQPSHVPADQIRQFVLDAKRQGRARRLALELLTRLDTRAPARLIPRLLDDPEFRRDAVAVAIEEGRRATAESNSEKALASFLRGFDAARDVDQVRELATALKSLGRDVSIVEHLGFIVDWRVIGPFDGPNFTAFANVYPPERELNFDARYEGQSGPVSWRRVRTQDEFGTVDLVKALRATDDAAAYALAQVISPESRTAQLRCGADDNIRVWLNGEQVFAKEEWQNGTRLDRFVTPIRLQAGVNSILVKVCQGPKYRDPGMANPWSLQLRVCDSAGKGIPLSTRD